MPRQDVENLILSTERGPYCPAGGFYIDPWRPVHRAIITHAHSDHASPGSHDYLASVDCVPLLRLGLRDGFSAQPLSRSNPVMLGSAHSPPDALTLKALES